MNDLIVRILNRFFKRYYFGNVARALVMLLPFVFLAKYYYPFYIDKISSGVSELIRAWGLEPFLFLIPLSMIVIQAVTVFISILLVIIAVPPYLKARKSEYSLRKGLVRQTVMEFYFWMVLWNVVMMMYGGLFNPYLLKQHPIGGLTLIWIISILTVRKLIPILLGPGTTVNQILDVIMEPRFEKKTTKLELPQSKNL